MSSNSAAKIIDSNDSQHEQMSWDTLLCADRMEQPAADEHQTRSEFAADYDRVIFSRPFRRLARKTQVHPMAENDHTHNRLTHSLEVASVGRSLGKAAYHIAKHNESNPIPADDITFAEIVQAACLAHDIGNTPFGHAGERAIRHWMNEHLHDMNHLNFAQRSDLTLYEGNAQAFRLATRSVNEFDQNVDNRTHGIGLTAATLATMMKYPWHSDHPYAQQQGKYSVFQDDLNAFDFVTNKTGLLFRDNAFCRHPLVFLVEAADDICNAVIDIEDAIELHIVQREVVEDAFIQLSGLSSSSTVAQMRSKAISALIEQVLQVFALHYKDIMHGAHHAPLVSLIDHDMLQAFNFLNDVARNQIYPFQQNDELDTNCKQTLAYILNATTLPKALVAFSENDIITRPFNTFLNNVADAQKSQYEQFMMIMDFVAGMTDNYATGLSIKLAQTSYK